MPKSKRIVTVAINDEENQYSSYLKMIHLLSKRALSKIKVFGDSVCISCFTTIEQYR